MLEPRIWDLSVIVVHHFALLDFIVGALGHLQVTAGGIDSLETASLALILIQERGWWFLDLINEMAVRLHLAEVVGAGTADWNGRNAVLAGSTGHSDGALDTLVPVVVESECAADAEALVTMVLVSAATSGGLSDVGWGEVAIELLLPLHSVEVDRLESAAARLDLW